MRCQHSLEAPNTKLQAPEKLQTPSFKAMPQTGFLCLELGVWSFGPGPVLRCGTSVLNRGSLAFDLRLTPAASPATAFRQETTAGGPTLSPATTRPARPGQNPAAAPLAGAVESWPWARAPKGQCQNRPRRRFRSNQSSSSPGSETNPHPAGPGLAGNSCKLFRRSA